MALVLVAMFNGKGLKCAQPAIKLLRKITSSTAALLDTPLHKLCRFKTALNMFFGLNIWFKIGKIRRL